MFAQIWSERVKGNQHTGDLSAEEKILLKLILKENVMVWITFSSCRIGANEGAITKAVMKIRVS